MIVLGNVANLSLLSVAIPGPEAFLAGRPLLVVTMVAAQIVVTLVLTGMLARRPGDPAPGDRALPGSHGPDAGGLSQPTRRSTI